MNVTEYVLSLAGTACSLLAACITFAVKLYRAARDKKAAMTREQILKLLPTVIEQAERFMHYTGEEKKEYVLTRVNRFALDNGLPFDAAYVADKIEELVALSKQVNTAKGVY